MKKIATIICFTVSVCFFTSCATYKVGMENAKYDPLPTKLPNLEYSFNSNSAVNFQQLEGNFIKTTIKSELTTNCISTDGPQKGTLRVNCKNNITGGYGMLVLSLSTLYTLNLLGMPFSIIKGDLNLEFTITDIFNNPIKSYPYAIKVKSPMGFYYGRVIQVVYIDETKSILEKFRQDLNNDIIYINQELNKDKRQLAQNNQQSNQATERTYSVEELKALGVLGNKDQQSTAPTENTSAQPASQPARILSDVDQNIPITDTKADNTFVLIIANEDYAYNDKVSFAKNDGNTFKEYCIKTLGVPEDHITLCENATLGNIKRGLSKMVMLLNTFNAPNAIVYYCGHGIPDEKTSDPYIIPVDGDAKDMTTCYSLYALYKTLADTKAANVTYFMDACYTGTDKDGAMLVPARGVAREPRKDILTGNTVIFSATSKDETAMTYNDKQHGLFTYYLLKKLQETNGDVSYEELSNYITQKVKEKSALINEKWQSPEVNTSTAAQTTWKNMRLK